MQDKHSQSKTFCDTHVHIYDCFELESLLDGAAENFRQAAEVAGTDQYESVIMLTEISGDDRFTRMAESAAEGERSDTGWSFSPTSEPESLVADREGRHTLLIIAGRQIITKEKLEILALATTFRCPDGRPADEVIEAINAAGGIAVAPWGVGKWWGKRGRFMSSLLQHFPADQLALGDNSGRPWFMRSPAHFETARQQSRRILPGSDPLPFPTEARRAGSVGCVLDYAVDAERPAADLRNGLADSARAVTPYMRYERLLPFLRNQVRMQLRKKLS
jgi:hypothetical protein